MRAKGGTFNFYEGELDMMQENPNKRAMRIGKTVPYHLQYVLDEKPNIKPEEEDGGVVQDKQRF
ncbi:MAG: hypothetical protein J6Q48_06095 [Bacteroidaceae bacterium]|nr:hypothetical protein [Bacteroidaceae bacterium]